VITLGVEEELMILDAETYEPVAASHLLVGKLASGLLKTELHASVIELATRVCPGVDDVIASLQALRAAAAARAAVHGYVVAAAGSHPTATLDSLPVVQEERYLSMIRDIGHAARRQGVNGLHVHVGADGDLWERLEAVLGWLPAVLALSCNSPFLDGVETGMLSNRAAVLAELPRGGEPPTLRRSSRTLPGKRGSSGSSRSVSWPTTPDCGGTYGRIHISARSRSASPTSRRRSHAPSCSSASSAISSRTRRRG
jgi:glutamate---cysteine ligase / carboxylate-amine ligase